MKIAIISAMEEEIKSIKSFFNAKFIEKIFDCDFYHAEYTKNKQLEIIIVKTNIGKTNSAIGSTILKLKYNPDLVINAGIAGKICKCLNVGDIVIGDKFSYNDANSTALGFNFGQIPGMPEYYESNNKLICNIKNKYNFKILNGLILSGDSFKASKDDIEFIRKKFPNAYAVDMESTSIAQCCHIFNTKFEVVRCISDSADDNAQFDYEKFMHTACKNLSLVIRDFIENFHQ